MINKYVLFTISTDTTNSSDDIKVASDVSSMFNLIGCPLLLACMCIERYLAAAKPMVYLKMKRWEYRVAVSVVVWLITLSFCLATGKC